MAIGNLVAQAVTKTLSLLKEGVADAIKGAIAQEDADRSLWASLELTGREVEGNAQHFKDYASSLQKATIYGDEEIQSVQSLLLQMTKLDQEGIDRATKGTLGLASALGMDLHAASLLVQKAMAGQFATLSRYGIVLDENLSAEGKKAQLLEKLDVLYGRAIAQTETFSGRVAQLKNAWGDAQEEIGNAIVQNEKVRDLITEVKDRIVELIESGKLDEWAERIAVGVNAAVRGIEALMGITEKLAAGKGLGDWLAEQIVGGSGAKKWIAEVTKAHADLVQNLKIVKPNMEELALHLKKGGAEWEAYKQAVIAADQQLQKERAMPQYAPAIAGARELTDSQKELLKAQKAAFSDEIIKQINDAEAALAAYAQTGRATPEGIRNMETYIENLRKGLRGLTPPLTESQKAIAEEIRWLRMLGTTFDAVGGAAPLSEGLLTLQQRLYGTLAPMFDLSKGANELDAEFEEMRQKAGDAANGVGLILRVDLRKDLREKEEQLRRFGDAMPYAEVKKLKEEIARLKRELAAGTAWDKFADDAKEAMENIQAVTSQVFGQLDSIFAQSQTNREIAIENEYKKRLAVINRTIADEDARQNAIMALEAEYQIKKSEARAKGAKAAKAVAMLEAVVNTASAIAEALPNIPLAILVGALGAIQIGVIAAQPIPLAKGGYFDKATLLPGRNRDFLIGEAEPEIASPVPVMRQVVREELRALVPAMAGGSFTLNGGISVYAPDISPSGIRKVGEDIWREMEHQARRRGYALGGKG